MQTKVDWVLPIDQEVGVLRQLRVSSEFSLMLMMSWMMALLLFWWFKSALFIVRSVISHGRFLTTTLYSRILSVRLPKHHLLSMVKNKKNKKGKSSSAATSTSVTATFNRNTKESLDDLIWLAECEIRRDRNGEPLLQLEYQPEDELVLTLHDFLKESSAASKVIDDVHQIWQQTVVSTLLESSALWKREDSPITAADQRHWKDHLKLARYKINFIMHHVVASMLTSDDDKWLARRDDLLKLCLQTLELLPRLAESCPHHRTDIRQTIIHFEAKEFLAAVACETWDTLYDYSIELNEHYASLLIPILRRCAMLDILDKDWNMLGGWNDILKGLETKCFPTISLHRIPSDIILHEQTTTLRNARNSMQCKFFSVRFMRYTDDQAPQRWRYFAKCSAPTCGAIETPENQHPYRCKKCWYFHFCSPACQEYCNSIMGLHWKFCTETPPKKAAACRRETQQYLGWASDMEDEDERITCHACGATEKVDLKQKDDNSKMKRCRQCRLVCYCSRQCQEWDWRVGGHQRTCKVGTQQHDGGGSLNALN